MDTLGRPIRDLRISVTDRCNFRCSYCMPKTVFNRDFKFMPHDSLLTFEEIERVARIFVDQGVEKLRITGGEPLMRRHLERLIEKLAKLPVELTLTTNASLLARKAQSLKDAGLQRVTVSAGRPRRRDLQEDERHGLPRCRTCSKASRRRRRRGPGAGQDQYGGQARRERPRHPAHGPPLQGQRPHRSLHRVHGRGQQQRLEDGRSRCPRAPVVDLINAELPIEPANPNYRGEVAKRWKFKDGSGEIGVISSVTEAFCSSCTRLRLSPEGSLYTCLFAQGGHDIRQLLRGGANDETITRAIQGIWQQRGDRYSEIRTADTAAARKVEMHYIGG